MQEEVEQKSVNLAVKSSKVTVQVLYKGLKAFINHQKRKAAMKAAEKDEPIKGEQSVKELIGQWQGVSSIKEYTAKQMKKQQRQMKPSILEKLKKFKDIVAKTPRKEKEKRKEQTR